MHLWQNTDAPAGQGADTRETMARHRKTRRSNRGPARAPRTGPVGDERLRGPEVPAAPPALSAERTFLLCGGLLGLVLLLLVPPFQVPDEPQHFYRAFQTSELRFLTLVALNKSPNDNNVFRCSLKWLHPMSR